jgi:hypothetical protein
LRRSTDDGIVVVDRVMADELLTRAEFVRDMDARDERLRQDIDTREQRLRQDMDARDDRLRQDMDTRDQRLRQYMDAREERILNAFKMHTEQLRDDVKKLAEGYGANLERIERELIDTRREWHAKWALHDATLKNHATRITKLESGQSTRG